MWPKEGSNRSISRSKHEVKRSTIYNWLKAFRTAGLPALVNRDRSDRGEPRAFNQPALEFIMRAALPKPGEDGNLSVREIYRLYAEERAWRESRAGKKVGGSHSEKYARFLAEDGCLRPDTRLPAASYATFRRWFKRLPAVVRVMSREGNEAYANTQEILSFRNLTALQPMDYVVMDHRQLDLFLPHRTGAAARMEAGAHMVDGCNRHAHTQMAGVGHRSRAPAAIPLRAC